MQNLILFINQWLSYMLLFLIMGGLILTSVFIGIRLRIKKNEEEALTAGEVLAADQQE